MPSASWELQKSIYSALTSNTALLTLLGAPRIYDDAPQDVQFPYVTLGEGAIRDWSTGTDAGDEHALTVHVWSRAAGRRESLDLMGALRDALNEASLSLSGFRLINLRHEVSETRREGDGQTYHGVVRFRAVTEPTA